MSSDWRQDLKNLPSIVPRFELEPQATALVIVDMQYMFAHPDYGHGAMLKSRYPQAAAYLFQRLNEMVIPNHLKLLQVFREHQLRVIYLTVGTALPDGADMVPLTREKGPDARVRARRYGKWLARVGSQEHKILAELAPVPGELVINKTSFSAFNSTGIDSTLRNMGIEYLVITGTATNVCVETTARDAADKGYRAIIVEDAVATVTPEFQEVTLKGFACNFGRVETTEAICEELKRKLGFGA
ncbi:MAG: isochorismatase family cysteine hydrolase [Dehalococcoidia bacterium]|nr:isochorismatase family cysteine hydrolase [Dehalococcoidia bacterium]